MRPLLSLLLTCCTIFSANAAVLDNEELSAHDRHIIEQFIQHAVNAANKIETETIRKKCLEAPEMFAWVDFRNLICLNTAYALSRDTSHLDLFKNTFAKYKNLLSKEHDEFFGWHGKPIKSRIPKDQPDLLIDEIQMTFRGISALCQWIELARSNPAYAEQNQDTINAYLTLMEEHLFPKWDARGHFTDLHERGGVYHGLNFPIKGQVSLSFEKLSMMMDGSLRLYRVSKNPKYMKRALQIGAWFKRHLQLKDEHYEWMSWAPAGSWDVKADNTWKTGWIAADPNGAWYVAGVEMAIKLYQYDLLFTEQDLQRFLKTQKEQCWNGDMEKPVYRNVAGVGAADSKWIKGRFLSLALARYDETLQQLAFAGPHEAKQHEKASSPWHGGTNAQAYVTHKYLSLVDQQNPQPHKALGQEFLQDPENKTFYETLFFEVTGSGAREITSPEIYWQK